MAYQTRGRDPLFDSETQALLEKRGRELVGVLLIAAGVALALMLTSYTPDDPSWMSVTSDPAANVFGRFGASIAAALVMVTGIGGWGLVLAGVVWGGRFILHIGADRVWSRAVFVPIGVALFSIYASTHAPGAAWPHSFGLGGLFGDMALGTLLGLVGVSGVVGLKLMALAVMASLVVISGFVLGMTTIETKRIVNWLLRGSVLTYAGLIAGLGLGQRSLGRGARAAATRIADARAARADGWDEDEEGAYHDAPEPEPARLPRAVLRATREPVWTDHDEGGGFDGEDDGEQRRTPGLLGRIGGMLRREDDVFEDEMPDNRHAHDDGPEERFDGPDDRIRARIADAVQQRARSQPVLTAGHRDVPSIRRKKHPRDPKPMILPKEPPVSARTAPPAMQAAAEHDVADFAVVEAEDDGAMFDDAPEAAPAFAPRAPVAEPPRAVVQSAPRKRILPSSRAKAEAQPSLSFADEDNDYEMPPLSLLTHPNTITRHVLGEEALEENARMLETVLDDYGVKGEIVSVRPGPVVTMYELEPAPGLKASRVIGLADDIARSMSALSARVSTVPGRSVIGIELPNDKREMCVLREILASREFGDGNHHLPLALGKDIGGDPIVANLAKMPHLLIAGTTGSGKSVAINTMILSLLYKLTPEECRLIMIDPKMLELSVYDGIPHLLSPVVTDPKKAVVALKWVVGEMEERYRKMSRMGVRNIEGFNSRVRDALSKGELFERTVQTGFDEDTGEPIFETEETVPEILPFIVVVVDEMADLMMVAGKEIEACIQRLAQMARASGIHLIMATQRPSVDVITGTIKANFPTRISFQVTSKIDSRTILGEQGAEQLLGMGDMLYMAGGSRIVRVHGPFCSDEEVEDVVNHLKSFGPPDYKSGVVEGPDEDRESDIDAVLGLGGSGGNTSGEDAQYDEAVAIVARDRKCSTSYIQRKLGIGYNKAARLVEQMEDQGVVSPANHVGKREVLVPEVQ